MGSITENWDEIKNLTWHKFPNQQISLDDKEYKMIMRRKNESIVVIKYIHFSNPNDIGYNMLLDIGNEMDKLRKFGNSKFENPDFVILSNLDLSKKSSYALHKLPLDFKYYYFDNLYFNLLDIEKSLRENEPPGYRIIGILPERKYIDDEDTIMRALGAGEGDRFGF